MRRLNHISSLITFAFLAVLTAIGSLALSSCESPADGSSSGLNATTGTVTVTIPTIAPELAAMLEAGRALSAGDAGSISITALSESATDSKRSAPTGDQARALLSLSFARVRLYDSTQTLIASEVISETLTGKNAKTATFAGVPVGTGYTIAVDAFNAAVSSSEPVVAGTSAAFDLTASGATVSLNLKPTHPISLVSGTSQSVTFDTLFTGLYASGATKIGTEKWFELTPTKSEIEVSVDGEYNDNVFMFLYDSAGTLVWYAQHGWGFYYTSGWAQANRVYVPVTAGATYYLGLVAASSDKTALTVDVGFSDKDPTLADALEDNDTAATATPLTLGTSVAATFDTFDDIDYYSIPVTAGKKYTVTNSSPQDGVFPYSFFYFGDLNPSSITSAAFTTNDTKRSFVWNCYETGTLYFKLNYSDYFGNNNVLGAYSITVTEENSMDYGIRIFVTSNYVGKTVYAIVYENNSEVARCSSIGPSNEYLTMIPQANGQNFIGTGTYRATIFIDIDGNGKLNSGDYKAYSDYPIPKNGFSDTSFMLQY
jgi:hypothetical protein